MSAASAVSTRSGRAVFILGGALFVVAGSIALVQTPLTPVFAWVQSLGGDAYGSFSVISQTVGGVVAALAMVVFAVGARSGGSVVARKPLGMISLLVFAVWPYVALALWTLVPYETMAGMPVLTTAIELVPVVAGLIAVIEIVRIGAVPGWWRWLPALAYLALVGTVTFGRFAQNLWTGGETYAPIVLIPYAIFLYATFIAPLVLGIAAIALAAIAGRRESRSEERLGDVDTPGEASVTGVPG